VGSVELGGHEVIFHGHYQGSNVDQYWGTNLPRQGDPSQYQYLSEPVYHLNKDQRAAYIAVTGQQILEFLEI
jgi:hypothetical protein